MLALNKSLNATEMFLTFPSMIFLMPFSYLETFHLLSKKTNFKMSALPTEKAFLFLKKAEVFQCFLH